MVRSRAKISTIYPPAVNELWTGQQQRQPRTNGCSGDRSPTGTARTCSLAAASNGFERQSAFRSWDGGRRQEATGCLQRRGRLRPRIGMSRRLSLFDPLMQFVVDIAPNQQGNEPANLGVGEHGRHSL